MSENRIAFNSPLIREFSLGGNTLTLKGGLIRYHYTSPQGLLSILGEENPSIRFTDVRYMNDKSEMVLFVKRLLEVLDQGDYPFTKEIVDELLLVRHSKEDYLNLKISQIEFSEAKIKFDSLRSFVFCTSRSNDDLNMWNYYVKNGNYQGYNIGFNIYNLLKSFDTSESNYADNVIIRYGQVIYTKEEQHRFITDIITDIEKEQNKDLAMIKLRGHIENYSMFFKSEFFKSEVEYRIVIEISQKKLDYSLNTNDNLFLKKMEYKFSEKGGLLIPYLLVPIKRSAIKSLTISPTIDSNLAIESTREFLKKYKYQIEPKQSAIPVRF